MDPDTALRELRALTALPHREQVKPVNWRKITDLLRWLDRWMANGGFPPRAWRVGVSAAELGAE